MLLQMTLDTAEETWLGLWLKAKRATGWDFFIVYYIPCNGYIFNVNPCLFHQQGHDVMQKKRELEEVKIDKFTVPSKA